LEDSLIVAQNGKKKMSLAYRRRDSATIRMEMIFITQHHEFEFVPALLALFWHTCANEVTIRPLLRIVCLMNRIFALGPTMATSVAFRKISIFV